MSDLAKEAKAEATRDKGASGMVERLDAAPPLVSQAIVRRVRAAFAVAGMFWAAMLGVSLWVLVSQWPDSLPAHSTLVGVTFVLGLAMLGAWAVARRIELGAARQTHLQAEARAQQDFLTGLLNHGAFSRVTDRELGRAQRYGRPLGLVFIDIDDFKVINDRLGHNVGDEVLSKVGKLLRDNIRSSDVAARYGGDEFVVLLPEGTPHECLGFAQRLLSRAEASDFTSTLPQGVQLLLSIGLASFPDDGSTLTDLLNKADRACYSAKNQGGNRVVQQSEM